MTAEEPILDPPAGDPARNSGRAPRIIHRLVPWSARLVIGYTAWTTAEVVSPFVLIFFVGPLISLGLIEAGFLVTEAERPPERRGSRAVGRMVAMTMPLAASPVDVSWLIVVALSVGLRVVTKGLASVVLPAILALTAVVFCVQTREGTLVNLAWGATAGVLILHAIANMLTKRAAVS